MNASRWYILLAAVSAVLGALFLLPIALVVKGGFWVDGAFTLDYLLGVFRNPIYAEGLANSFAIAAGTTLLAMAIALPLAWISHKYDFPGKALFSALRFVLMILPPFVGAIGMTRSSGAIWRAQRAARHVCRLAGAGACWRCRHPGARSYLIAYLPTLGSRFANDPAMEEAAANLGCPGWRRFFRITLPLIAPGLFRRRDDRLHLELVGAGRAADAQLHDVRLRAGLDALWEIGSSPFPYALVFVVLACSTALYAVGKPVRVVRTRCRGKAAVTFTPSRALRGVRAALPSRRSSRSPLTALLPHLGVIFTSFAAGLWYWLRPAAGVHDANYAEAPRARHDGALHLQ